MPPPAVSLLDRQDAEPAGRAVEPTRLYRTDEPTIVTGDRHLSPSGRSGDLGGRRSGNAALPQVPLCDLIGAVDEIVHLADELGVTGHCYGQQLDRHHPSETPASGSMAPREATQ